MSEASETEVLAKTLYDAGPEYAKHKGGFEAESSEIREATIREALAVAAKDARIAELEAEYEKRREATSAEIRRLSVLEGHLLATRASALGRAERAESALATLRQAVERAVVVLGDVYGHRTTEEIAMAPSGSQLGAWRDGVNILRSELSTTPAEHPDTAALRSMREQTREACGWVRREMTTGEPFRGAVLLEHLQVMLGDSGPSGGGGGGRCDACVGPEVTCSRTCWRENRPTAPPDAGSTGCTITARHPGNPGDMLVSPTPDVAASEADRACEATGHDHPETGDGAGPCRWCGTAASEPTPTPEEDWEWLKAHVMGHDDACMDNGWKQTDPCVCGAKEALERLARLRDEPRRAAERMRRKCLDAIQKRAGYIAPEDDRSPFAAKLVRDIEKLSP